MVERAAPDVIGTVWRCFVYQQVIVGAVAVRAGKAGRRAVAVGPQHNDFALTRPGVLKAAGAVIDGQVVHDVIERGVGAVGKASKVGRGGGQVHRAAGELHAVNAGAGGRAGQRGTVVGHLDAIPRCRTQGRTVTAHLGSVFAVGQLQHSPGSQGNGELERAGNARTGYHAVAGGRHGHDVQVKTEEKCAL
jgi:hypothetical protein